MAGSAASAGGSSPAGSGSAGAPVVRVEGYGLGVAGSANSGGRSFVSCEQAFDNCPDGRSYYSVCVTGDHAEELSAQLPEGFATRWIVVG
jgi:hypothetical protein